MIIFACSDKVIHDITLYICVEISAENSNLWYNILYYVFIFIIFLGYAITLTIVCIEYFNEFRYILRYSILLNMLLVIIVTLIKSFYVTIDYVEVSISFIAILLGVFIQIIVKIKQIKGEIGGIFRVEKDGQDNPFVL
jgi:hypothetical protein